jgi:hypothetical protein
MRNKPIKRHVAKANRPGLLSKNVVIEMSVTLICGLWELDAAEDSIQTIKSALPNISEIAAVRGD